jgi:cytochrome b involved in lipid metabolism
VSGSKIPPLCLLSLFFYLLVAVADYPSISNFPYVVHYQKEVTVIEIKVNMSETKKITLEEVAKHNKESDCWLIIGNDKTGTFDFELF